MTIDFNNETKEFSRDVPFARIKSRRFGDVSLRADGRGLDCGCRDSDDYEPTFIAAMLAGGLLDAAGNAIPIPAKLKEQADKVLKQATGKDIEDFKKDLADFIAKQAEGLLFKSALRMVPSWVPVGRKVDKTKKTMDTSFKEVDREVQGRLTRSFQAALDPVVLPWTRFYGWNFHVRVDPGGKFDHVIGPGNVLNESEREALGGDLNTGDMDPAFDAPVTSRSPLDASFECIWDVGAFSQTPGNAKNQNFRPGVMFHEKWPFWPMAGDRFWAQGRWVYDCGHVTRFKETQTDKDVDLMWTQINPCRAIAFYRAEGVKFDEEEKVIPAARFFFFASVKGGYKNFDEFTKLDAADDPVFIVDLPPAPVPEKIRWTIGHSPEFEMNTVVLRPRLRIKIEHAPFGIPSSDFARDLFSFARLDPTIEPIKSKKELTLPDQLKITLPLHQVDKECYGVVVSAGWADPTGEQAARTRKITVKFDELRDVKHGSGSVLRVKLAASGHWAFSPTSVGNGRAGLAVELPPFHLPDDARLVLGAHGVERRGRGEFLERNPDEERQLHVGGLFQFGNDELEEMLKRGQKTVQVIVDGQTVTIGVEELKKLQEILGAAAELLKKRRPVVWDKDVDQPDNSIASAVARETFFKPVGLFNKRDAPLALADLSQISTSSGGFTTSTRLENGASRTYEGHLVSDLVAQAKSTGAKTRVIRIAAPITEVVGDAHLYGLHRPPLGPTADQRHYLLVATVKIEDQ